MSKTDSANSVKILYLVWGILLIFMSILWPLLVRPLPPGPISYENFDYSKIIASSSIFMKFLLVVGGVISFALCFLWYRFSQSQEQRSYIPRAIGIVLFLLGTLVLVIIFGMPAEMEVLLTRTGASTGSILLLSLLSLSVGGLMFPIPLLIASYFLQFRGIPNIKKLATIIFVIIASLALIGIASYKTFKTFEKYESYKPVVVGGAAPDFELKDLTKNTIKLSDYKGKVVFLNFWATWCKPCKEEMPTMERLYKAMKGKNFEIIAVSIDKDISKVEPFVKELKLTFPILLDFMGKADRRYKLTGVPETYIIDQNGVIVEKILDPRDWTRNDNLQAFLVLLENGDGK